MNNQFSTRRLASLFAKHTAEHYKNYLLSLAVAAGLIIIIVSFIDLQRREPMTADMQLAVFNLLFLLAGSIFTSRSFSELDDPKSAIASLVLPASAFEKFLVKWVYTYLVFQVVFIGMFLAVLQPVQGLFHYQDGKKETESLLFQPGFLGVLLAYALLHAVALWGAIFFRKLHFIKTAFSAMMLYWVIVFLNKLMLESMLGIKVMANTPFSVVGFTEGSRIFLLGVPDGSATTLLNALVIVCTAIIWAAAYFRLTEKQV